MTRTPIAVLACAFALTAAAQTPAPAPAASPPGRIANLKTMGCEEFLQLKEGERSAVVWYISGDFKEAGRTAARFDLDLTGKAVPQVVEACTRKPQASLTYTVVSWFKANTPRPVKKVKAKRAAAAQ